MQKYANIPSKTAANDRVKANSKTLAILLLKKTLNSSVMLLKHRPNICFEVKNRYASYARQSVIRLSDKLMATVYDGLTVFADFRLSEDIIYRRNDLIQINRLC